MRIPFNRTIIGSKEKEAVLSALEKGSIFGGGIFTQQVEERLKILLGGRTVLATTSGTHALEMAACLSGLKLGDEVVMPSYTYPSTANCILKVGGKPIFADLAEEGMNAGLEEIKAKITGRTRAILAVHYGGLSRDVKALRELADKEGLILIEDAAQALGSEENGHQLGTWGDFACFSFHSTKNFKAGEGGALVIGKGHEKLINKAEAIRNGGTDRAKFFRGEISHYQWVEEGSMYLPSDLLMALLGPQLETMDSIIKKRIFAFKAYERLLEKYKGCKFIREYSQSPTDGRAFNAHLFFIVFKSREERRYFQNEMERVSIQAYTHYWPLHASTMGIAMGYKEKDLPRTYEKAPGLVRLPLYENLSLGEIEYVVSNTERILDKMARGE